MDSDYSPIFLHKPLCAVECRIVCTICAHVTGGNRRDKGVGVGGGGTSQTTYISPQQKHDRGYSIITKYGST